MLQVEVAAAGDAEMAAKAVERRLHSALREKGKLRIVVGRQLRRGDVAIIDFAIARTDRSPDGEPVLGSEKRGMQLDTMLAEDTINIPGALALAIFLPRVCSGAWWFRACLQHFGWPLQCTLTCTWTLHLKGPVTLSHQSRFSACVR